jgi:glycosyltransferase involved in cell wall biosynthesis
VRIAFLISSLGYGGAERVASLLASAWSVGGHDVSVVTFEHGGVSPTYPLSERVSLVQLGLSLPSAGIGPALRNNCRRIKVLRRCLQGLQPDIVVSFMTETNVLALAAGLFARWPTVVSERIHPAHHALARRWTILRRLLYPRAAAIVAQTRDIASWLRLNVHADACVIPNPVDIAMFGGGVSKKAPAGQRKLLLSVGRLDAQKGFDVLVDAFALAASRIPEWDLAIFGEGPSRGALERQIAARGMTGRIALNGLSSDIGAVYRSADGLVHAARYEGYPNVVIEALAAGLPVIAIDSPGGIRDLLREGRYGVLVVPGSADALADALASTLPDQPRLETLAQNAPTTVRQNDVGIIAEKWLELFRTAIATRSRAGRISIR